jgi:hypothetical protein
MPRVKGPELVHPDCRSCGGPVVRREFEAARVVGGGVCAWGARADCGGGGVCRQAATAKI